MPNNTPSSLETGGSLSGDGFSNPKERIFNLLAQLKNPGQRKERRDAANGSNARLPRGPC
jgi:hypothetical protein